MRITIANLFSKEQAQKFVKDNQLQDGMNKDNSGAVFTSQGNITIGEGCLSVIFNIEDINIANKVLKVLKPYLKFRNPDLL